MDALPSLLALVTPDDTPGLGEATLLADGFARRLAAWANPVLAPAERDWLAAAGRQLSLAASAGHVCIAVDEWRTALPTPPAAEALREALQRSGLVGSPGAPGACPLILDPQPTPEAPEGKLYLHRLFDLECRLARRVRAAALAPDLPVGAAAQTALRTLFAPGGRERGGAPESDADWQQLGAALALTRRLAVISGGPGTGKTTTVVNLLAALLQQVPEARIALAAPTGKAAARMTEAIRDRAQALDPAIVARLPTQGSTIHRLLGWGPQGFRHGAEQPLPVDVLVVDEASMLDLALATQLLEAVPPQARIVLLGDKDQLAAVDAGSVFADLSADPSLSDGCRQRLADLCGIAPADVRPPPPARPGGLPDSALWFTRNYRFAADSGIGRLAMAIRDGQADTALDLLSQACDQDPQAELCWLDAPGPELAPALRRALQQAMGAYLQALRDGFDTPALVLTAFDAFRVLCAVREGPRGSVAVNEMLVRHLREQLSDHPRLGRWAKARSPWWAGRAVMVLRNDYGLGLFNGDIGITLPDLSGQSDDLRVYFPSAAAGGVRAIAPARLPSHDTAFAMTVHKSQGSEFDHALLLLPDRRVPVCSRELVYTGVTRARHRVTLAAAADVLRAAIAAPTRRQGGLVQRLAAD